MAADDAPKLYDLFDQAAILDGCERERFLADACGEDGKLRSAIEELLAHDCTDTFLQPLNHSPQQGRFMGEPDPMLGRRIGAYEIQRKLGAGGMGNVYLGRRTADFSTQVAIKLIRRGMDSEAILHRFQDEMQFQAALGKHPNIAQMIDAGETAEGLPYFVMEYVDAERIDRWCDSQRLSVRKRLALFQEVCSAVQFAHQNTVIHRDLKPSNILVNADGRPILIDFGIAKLLGDTPELPAVERTITGMQVLTPEYASPEQIRGEQLTTATDVYSLGVVLYELLTGRRPCRPTARTPLEMLREISESNPLRPSDVVLQAETVVDHAGTDSTITPDEVAHARDVAPGRLSRMLRGDLDRVVLMALRKEPERRYSSAEQLAEDVRRYLKGLPVRAQRDTWIYRARKFAKRNWAALAASALVVSSLLAGGAFSLSQWNRAEAEAAHARQSAVDESLAKEEAQAAQVQAETEAGKAKATVEFLLNDMIYAAHPSNSGYQVTVLEAVESSLDKIGERFTGQPKIEAAVRSTAAEMLKELGQFQDALSQYDGAYKLLLQELGPDHRDTIDARWGVGIHLCETNNSEKGIPILREVLEHSSRVLGDEDEITVGVMGGLGEQLQSAGQYEEATELLQKAIELHDRVYPLYDIRRAYSRNSLAACYAAQGKLAAAESIAREIVEFMETRAERRDDIYLASLSKLASILYSQQRYDDALPYVEKIVENLDEVITPKDVRRATIRGLYGRCLWSLGRVEEAEPHMFYQYEQAKEIRGPDDWLTEKSLASLRKFLYSSGKFDLAVKYHLESLRTRLRIAGTNQEESILAAFAEYTEAAQKYDRYPGEEALYDILTDHGINELPPDHPHRAQFLGNFGWALLQKGDYGRAEPLLLASFEERKETLGLDHGDVQWLLAALVKLYEESDRPDRMKEYESLILRNPAQPSDPPSATGILESDARKPDRISEQE